MPLWGEAGLASEEGRRDEKVLCCVSDTGGNARMRVEDVKGAARSRQRSWRAAAYPGGPRYNLALRFTNCSLIQPLFRHPHSGQCQTQLKHSSLSSLAGRSATRRTKYCAANEEPKVSTINLSRLICTTCASFWARSGSLEIYDTKGLVASPYTGFHVRVANPPRRQFSSNGFSHAPVS